MADETTTTKWDVNHEPTNEDNTTSDATSRVIGRGICSKVQPHFFFALGEWRWAWLAEFEISRSAPLDRYRVLVQVQRDMLCIRIYFVR